ncbi:MAG: LysM peptidoglycan-binding domain-containing M23 family metallopeptidase [Rhodospirillales bacterium]
MTLRWLIVILLPVLLVACAPRSSGPAPVVAGTAGVTQPAAQPAAGIAKGEVTYLVQSGDTVYAISRRFNVSVRSIIDLNNLQPPYLLYVGQRVAVPVTAIHVVRRGDTLSEIADRYGVGLRDLAGANGIGQPYDIYVGQQIRLPSAVITASNAPAAPRQGAPAPEPAAPRRPVTSSPLPEIARPEPAPPPAAGPQVVTRPAPPPPASSRPEPRTKPIEQASRAVPAPAARSGKLLDWPISGRVLSEFGPKEGGLHNDGLNIAAPRGSRVKAAENGVVAYVGDDIRAFGNLLLIKHADGLMTAYAHLERYLVKRGETVRKGQLVATVGSSGGVSTPQLHFEVRLKSQPVDPRRYLPKVIAGLP